MAAKTTLARPYAVAAFNYATEHDALDAWAEMTSLLGAISADAQMSALIAHPGAESANVAEMICDVAGERFDGAFQNFVKTMAAQDRLDLGAAVATGFAELRSKSEAKIDVEVTSAYKLAAAQKTAIADSMAKRLGKDVNIISHIDRSLMAGMIIRSGDLVVDASVRGRLDQLALDLG